MVAKLEVAFEAPQPPIDMKKMGAFMSRIVADMSGALACLLCALGDRLGLFQALSAQGPATAAELAGRAGIDERFAREWLNALACAGYLEFDAEGTRFTLPPEYAAPLAQEGGPMFMGGGYQQLLGLLGPVDQLVMAARSGDGVPQDAYGDDLWQGMERMSATWFDNQLVQHWIPLVPDLQSKLDKGIRVADVGCGSGRALINLAQAYPRSSFVGYDAFESAALRATANAKAAGVADKVRFETVDVAEGLPEDFDLITSFDSLHDFVEPLAALQAIRQALRPEGTYLVLEMNCSDKLADNVGPVGTILYGTSVFYNLPVSLANGGEGEGTMAFPESRVRRLCRQAGFAEVRRLPVQNPFNVLYEVTP